MPVEEETRYFMVCGLCGWGYVVDTLDDLNEQAEHAGWVDDICFECAPKDNECPPESPAESTS
jgi:hypothetical protein